MYSLIGSVVPCTFSRVDNNDPEREDDWPNNKEDTQEAENNVQADEEHTQKAEAQQNTRLKDEEIGVNTFKENTSGTEPITLDTNSQIDETETNFAETGNIEKPELKATRRNAGRELSAIFCFHAASVVLGAVAFAFMQYTSTDFLASCAKVKEASRVDLTKAVYIGGPAAFLASVLFRILHRRLGPWRVINKLPSCGAVCPPVLETKIEHFKVKLPNAVK